MRIEPVAPETAAAQRLLALSDAYMTALYPAESNHLASAADLKPPKAAFFGGYIAEELVACGAIKLCHDDIPYAEIKRLFVVEQHRGKGLSRQMMQHLETCARERGYTVIRLETGIRQPAALGLYAALGYEARGPFGDYSPDPLSLFLEKRLIDDPA